MIIDKIKNQRSKIKDYLVPYLLFLIIIVATVLRIWNLGGNPPHLTPDEAALGYNAYSILKTGRDEHGVFMPVLFESFGDWKPGLYIYATVPFVATLGLTEFSVRLPSALSGILAIFLVYKIVEILRLTSFAQDDKKLVIGYWSLEIWAALLLAVNPWHIMFSRGAWEVNLALTLTLGGVYFFIKALNSNSHLEHFVKLSVNGVERSKEFKISRQTRNDISSRSLILSVIFFALTVITYQGAKLSTAVVLFVLLVSFWWEIRTRSRQLIKPLVIGSVIGFFIVFPIILSLVSGKAGRLQVFSFFSYPRPTDYLQGILDQGNEIKNSLLYYLFHSETLSFARGLLLHFFNHFSGRFLFFEGDWQNVRHSAPNHGVLLLADLIFLPLGIIYLLKTQNLKLKKFVFLWLLLSPLPAVLSRDQVHAVRALNMVIPFTIISALGISYFYGIIKRVSVKVLRGISYGFLTVMFLGSFIYFLDAYFIHLPIHNANVWFYGYREAVREVTELQKTHKNVLFVQSYAQPYIYFLFYGGATSSAYQNVPYPPEKYQMESQIAYDSAIDVGLIQKLDNISFRGFSWPAPAVTGDIVVGTPIDIPDFFANDRFKMIKEIRQPNGNPAFRIVEKF